jgi:hypothetical protein
LGAQASRAAYPSGLSVIRHFDDARPESADEQCGSVALWQGYVDQLAHDSHEYYTLPDGTNKYFKAVEINAYSRFMPFPNAQLALALTYSLGAGKSRVDIQYFDPAADAYRFPAALSHEMGHAYHNWCGMYGNDGAGLEEVARCWERLVSSNHSTYPGHETAQPWPHDAPWEQWANAFRVLFGTYQAPGNTRGSSAPNTANDGTRDRCQPGFENPSDHLEWKRMMQFAPELCGFIRSYGVQPGTIDWRGWYFIFKTAKDWAGLKAGTWVYQDWYYSVAGRTDGWHHWDGSAWQQFHPSYTRT